MLENVSWIIIDFLKSNVVYSNPQIRVPTGYKNPEIMNIGVSSLSHNKIGKLIIQDEAE